MKYIHIIVHVLLVAFLVGLWFIYTPSAEEGINRVLAACEQNPSMCQGYTKRGPDDLP